MTKWVVYTDGVPTVENFATTQGAGPPLCIDRSTGKVYYLAEGDIPTEVPAPASTAVWAD